MIISFFLADIARAGQIGPGKIVAGADCPQASISHLAI